MSTRRSSSYVPDRGELIRLDLNPQAGREQAGRRPALVLSSVDFNKKTGFVVVCPLTNQAKGYPFEVPIKESAVTDGTATGVILADQAKSLDWTARNAEYFATLDDETVNQVVGMVIAIIDPENVFGIDGDSE